MSPVRHGLGHPYRDQLIKHIISQIEHLPGAARVVQALKTGNPSAVKDAYELARKAGLVLAYN